MYCLDCRGVVGRCCVDDGGNLAGVEVFCPALKGQQDECGSFLTGSWQGRVTAMRRQVPRVYSMIYVQFAEWKRLNFRHSHCSIKAFSCSWVPSAFEYEQPIFQKCHAGRHAQSMTQPKSPRSRRTDQAARIEPIVSSAKLGTSGHPESCLPARAKLQTNPISVP